MRRDQLTRIDVRIANDGYLGSYVIPSAKQLAFNEPVYATAYGHGCELVDSAEKQVLRHLDGWGQGLQSVGDLTSYPGTRGSSNTAWTSYLVSGKRAIELRVGSCRTGFVSEGNQPRPPCTTG